MYRLVNHTAIVDISEDGTNYIWKESVIGYHIQSPFSVTVFRRKY